MKLHFPISQIRNGLEELKTAKTVKPLYEQETGSGFWLVGDQGVYLMPNTTDGAHNAKSEKPLVIYAKECDPNALPFDTWWDNKRASFGGDDGVDFIARDEIENLLVNAPKARHLVIDISPKQFTIFCA